ncbi:hypothetical protein D6783_04030, partial [Candidatus Woesearchaeota archaeon]
AFPSKNAKRREKHPFLPRTTGTFQEKLSTPCQNPLQRAQKTLQKKNERSSRKKTKKTLKKNNPTYAALLHAKTFAPSNAKNGKRLNAASKLLTESPYQPRRESESTNNKGRKASANTILASGPAAAIIPLSLRLTWPEITTAPGAAKIKPKKLMTSASNKPASQALNSATNPNLRATKRCASSCRTNPVPTVTLAKANETRKEIFALSNLAR